MNNEFEVIELKLKNFIRKYYLSRIIKGFLFTAILFIALSFFLIVLEYFLYLPSSRKSWLLILYLLIQVTGITYFIIIPLFGYLGLKIGISRQHINEIIVKHFPEIKDQLWNLFELNETKIQTDYSTDLILASINQRINSLKKFNFSEAIQYKKHLKILLVFLISAVISALFILFYPGLVKESGKRLVHYKETFIKPSPFQYLLLNDFLSVGKGENFLLKVKVDASKTYEQLYLSFGGNTYLMKKDSTDFYSYQFNNINNSISFNFIINEFASKNYEILVLPKPLLSSFSVEIIKPRYTNLQSDTYENITELVIPNGSFCKFNFKTFETDSIKIIDDQNNIYYLSENFEWSNLVKNDQILYLSLINKHFFVENYLTIKITTIQDDYPSIFIQQLVDSIDYARVYFRGQIEDDYGFHELRFVTRFSTDKDSLHTVEIIKNLLQQDFFYAFNFQKYKGLATEIDYYFEVFDNDAINGPKASVSEVYRFVFPNVNDIFDYQEQQFDQIEDILANSRKVNEELKQDLFNLKEKMINSTLSEWERKELIKNIFSKKQSLEQSIKNIQDKNEEMNNYMDSFTDENKELIEKQQQIQNILEEVMSDELRKLMDEFNQMMNEFNQQKMNELTERMDISLDDLSEQLDRNLEMLKKMKIEKQLDLIQSELENHKQVQESLSKQMENGEKPDNLSELQQKEKEEVQKLKEQYNELKKLNEELEEPINLYDFNREFDEINKEFSHSMEQIKKNNKKKSHESMQKNQSNMENLAFMMQQMKEAAFAEQNAENMENLLQILDNTILFSFGQEALITQTTNNEFSNQLFIDQKKLFRDFKVIKDSLYALAKREPSVNMVVNEEIVNIENNFRRIDRDLTENRIPQARLSQQNVLTSANNLALFLSEVIKNLQQQMASSMPGDQNCQKPGNNPNPGGKGNSLKSMQQGLQQQLEKMMQMMKDGANGQQMNSEFGKALSQQEKMQQMLQQMMNQGNVGSDAFETLKQADQLLNKVREDIIRNNISSQTINRQKEILTRLLEAENAENEREIDDKRESNTAREQRISETAKYFDNNISNHNFNEKLIRQKLVLKKYYQQKYQDYINQLDSINGSNN
jgi:hypothetical protein